MRIGFGLPNAHELIYDVTFESQAQTLSGWLSLMEKLRKLV